MKKNYKERILAVVMLLVSFLFLLGLTIMVTGCSIDDPVIPQTPESKPVEVKPIIVKPQVYKFRWDNPTYTKYLVDALKSNSLLTLQVNDIKDFGTNDDPIEFWGNIFVEMAYFESKWKPETYYKESFGLYSRGLFQLSKVDGKRYGCDFTTEKSVHNEKANIECAVLVMEKLVKQNGSIAGKVSGKWQGGARYWSVLRGTRKYTAKALKAIKGANK